MGRGKAAYPKEVPDIKTCTGLPESTHGRSTSHVGQVLIDVPVEERGGAATTPQPKQHFPGENLSKICGWILGPLALTLAVLCRTHSFNGCVDGKKANSETTCRKPTTAGREIRKAGWHANRTKSTASCSDRTGQQNEPRVAEHRADFHNCNDQSSRNALGNSVERLTHSGGSSEPTRSSMSNRPGLNSERN